VFLLFCLLMPNHIIIHHPKAGSARLQDLSAFVAGLRQAQSNCILPQSVSGVWRTGKGRATLPAADGSRGGLPAYQFR
jgi:hypothetical protein